MTWITVSPEKVCYGEFSGGNKMKQDQHPKTYWREKLANHHDLPRVDRIPQRMVPVWGSGTILIPAPKEVDAVMKRVPPGKLITINEIRKFLAEKHGAAIGCPMTTGIFAWIAAHAADEAKRHGAPAITPYWRTLKADGVLNEKYPGGAAAQKKLLEREGHRVVKTGAKWVVVDFQGALVTAKRPRGRPPRYTEAHN